MSIVEKWLPINGYEGYAVSNLGEVKSFKGKQSKILKTKLSAGGYHGLNLCENNIRKCFTVHRLVAIYYVPNPENKPEVNHIDGDKSNNKFNNLEWATGYENMHHAYRLGLFNPKGEGNGNAKLTYNDVLAIRKEYGKKSTKLLALEYNISRLYVYQILNYKSWNQ